MALLDNILKHPDVVKPPDRTGEAKAWCPWHDDKSGGNPSLGINVKKNAGRGLAKCFVCGEGGLRKLADAWSLTPAGKASKLNIQKVYPYRDCRPSPGLRRVFLNWEIRPRA